MTDSDVEEWQSAIDIVLRRFAEYHDREGAFGRRAVTERAKGILMERHSVDDADAFEMLRDQSRRTNTKLAEVAAAVVDGHRLLPRQPDVSHTARSSTRGEHAERDVERPGMTIRQESGERRGAHRRSRRDSQPSSPPTHGTELGRERHAGCQR